MGSQFELNKGDQFIIALDHSGSMQETDCEGGVSRSAFVMETMRTFIRQAAQWDPDGVSFYVFHGSVCEKHPDVQKVEDIDRIIAAIKLPRGGTPTHLVLRDAFAEHCQKKSEQTFLMLFTDGEPSDPAATEQAVRDIANLVKDAQEFRISILTVGNRTPELDAWLTRLDDSLEGAKFDIVSIDRLEDVNFADAVDNAIAG